MEKENEIYSSDYFSISILNSCTEAYKLMNEGKEKDAKENFPLECYLLKKYMDVSITDFTIQLRARLNIDLPHQNPVF